MSKIKNNQGFTLVEIIVYIIITIMLMTAVGSLVINTFNARRQLQASEAIQHNARFIMNFMSNRIHNVSIIDDVSPAAEQILFYTSTSTRFSFTVENGNLLYREGKDTGSGFPPQASSTPLQVNSLDVAVDNLVLSATDDNFGNTNQAVSISFTLTTGNPANSYSYRREVFTTLVSIR